jgi:hypothetical protein
MKIRIQSSVARAALSRVEEFAREISGSHHPFSTTTSIVSRVEKRASAYYAKD